MQVAKYAFFFQTTAYCSFFLWGFVWTRAQVGPLDLSCGGGACYDYLLIKIPVFFVSVYVGGYLVRFLHGLVTHGPIRTVQTPPSDAEDGEGAEGPEVEGQRPGGFEADSELPKLAPWDVSGWYLSKLIELGFVVLFRCDRTLTHPAALCTLPKDSQSSDSKTNVSAVQRVVSTLASPTATHPDLRDSRSRPALTHGSTAAATPLCKRTRDNQRLSRYSGLDIEKQPLQRGFFCLSKHLLDLP